jgi:hypothetical protein
MILREPVRMSGGNYDYIKSIRDFQDLCSEPNEKATGAREGRPDAGAPTRLFVFQGGARQLLGQC